VPHGFSLKEHGFYLLNFILFVWLLVRFGRAPLSRALNDRADRIEKRMKEAAGEFETASGRLETARRKQAGLAEERAAMLRRMEEEGQRLSESVARRVDTEKARITSSTKLAFENEKARLEKALQAEIAAAALDKAENDLEGQWRRLEHARLVREFVAGIESRPTPEGK
jgi:F0F1-type ATP synthase membrane subunit b/b'